jgi:hypothetical protein
VEPSRNNLPRVWELSARDLVFGCDRDEAHLINTAID